MLLFNLKIFSFFVDFVVFLRIIKCALCGIYWLLCGVKLIEVVEYFSILYVIEFNMV